MKNLRDIQNDAVMAAFKPAIDKFLMPMLKDTREIALKFFVGPPPSSLSRFLELKFEGLKFDQDMVDQTWAACLLAISEDLNGPPAIAEAQDS